MLAIFQGLGRCLQGPLVPDIQPPAPRPGKAEMNDHFVERDGLRFAGTHLLMDFWGAIRLDDLPYVEQTLAEAVTAAGATLLHLHLHRFTPSGGISGVAVLAESHLSIHTWPELGFAALDIFMCGNTQPQHSLAVLEQAFQPQRIHLLEQRRGVL